MRRILLVAVTGVMFVVVMAAPALANHTIDVRTDRRAVLLSPTRLRVTGTITCAGEPLDAAPRVAIDVDVDGRPYGIDGYTDGYGYTGFDECLNETLPWKVIVRPPSYPGPGVLPLAKANEVDTLATTPCADWDYDCPRDEYLGHLTVKKAF